MTRRGRRARGAAAALAAMLITCVPRGGAGVALAQDAPSAQRAAAPEEDRARVGVALLVPRGLEAPPRPRAVESLLSAAARRTAIEVVSSPPPRLAPSDPRLFEHPLVVLTGTGDFEPFDGTELDRMRGYLSLGGMVIVDDASGDPGSPFLRRARTELSRALGGRAPEVVPATHAIYRSYYLLDGATGRVHASDALEALVVSGRAAVVFSANDLLGALARDELGQPVLDVTPGGGRQRELALRLGVNLLAYALTLDYKEDLVHLPLILERKR